VGFAHDASLSALRPIYSGAFDENPGLKLIVAHTGTVLSYLKGRIEAYRRPSPLIPEPPACAVRSATFTSTPCATIAKRSRAAATCLVPSGCCSGPTIRSATTKVLPSLSTSSTARHRIAK
jgi:hypothetical protein